MELSETVYSGQVIISTSLISYDSEYVFRTNFHHITTGIVIKKFDIELIKFNAAKNTMLRLKKVLPYSAMKPWDVHEYLNFAKIPDSLKTLNSSDNPYYAYDYIFKEDVANLGDKFIAKISADFLENDKEKDFRKEIFITKKSKLEIKPLDAHSDVSILLIPVTGLITVILMLIKIFGNLRRRQNSD